MSLQCPVCTKENRSIDGFDLIAVLGLMKEYNWKGIWKRYLPRDAETDSISMYVKAQRYFVEMHVQKMRRVILSEKFNTNPFFMQQVIQRIIASHAHDLILSKIQNQGIDTGDNPICLSCSLGNTIIDLIVNKNDPFPEVTEPTYGKTYVEQTEHRSLDIYDLSSTLYLCQQNLTDVIFRRYGVEEEASDTMGPSVHISAPVGDYRVRLNFRLVATNLEQSILPPGNSSAFTMHQVLQRMNFGHAPSLIHREMEKVGLSVSLEQVNSRFKLSRYINNTSLTLDVSKEAV
jgi:hypothetical protein